MGTPIKVGDSFSWKISSCLKFLGLYSVLKTVFLSCKPSKITVASLPCNVPVARFPSPNDTLKVLVKE